MGVHNYDELRSHVGHAIECVAYADRRPGEDHEPHNIAVECLDCGEVLFDFDRVEATHGD